MACNISLSGFYNQFKNQIDFETLDSVQYTYLNINNAKTTGFTVENKLSSKNMDASLGLSYIGFYRKFYNEKNYVNEEDKQYLWSPEVNASIGYAITKIKQIINLG